MLRMPTVPVIETSRYAHVRELRIQHDGRPYRVLYAFDQRRVAAKRAFEAMITMKKIDVAAIEAARRG